MIEVMAVNFRVASEPTYYPAHSKNGNNVDQRIVIRCVGNIASKANDGKGEVLGLNVVGWGKLADVLARSMALGKEFSVRLRPNVYKAPGYYRDPDHPERPPQPVYVDTDKGRIPFEHEKTSYRIKEIIFGADSAGTIAKEIAKGDRTPLWNVPGTADAEAWKVMLDKRNSEQYIPGSKKFGQATVRAVEGPGIGAFDPNKKRSSSTNATTAQAIADALQKAQGTLPAPATAMVPAVPAPAPSAPSTAVVAGL
jgi:hypothetical protein